MKHWKVSRIEGFDSPYPLHINNSPGVDTGPFIADSSSRRASSQIPLLTGGLDGKVNYL